MCLIMDLVPLDVCGSGKPEDLAKLMPLLVLF
jgi:hypothetical protein